MTSQDTSDIPGLNLTELRLIGFKAQILSESTYSQSSIDSPASSNSHPSSDSQASAAGHASSDTNSSSGSHVSSNSPAFSDTTSSSDNHVSSNSPASSDTTSSSDSHASSNSLASSDTTSSSDNHVSSNSPASSDTTSSSDSHASSNSHAPFPSPSSTALPIRAGRRDFYKMGLVTGDMTINYGGQLLDIKGTVLFFVNPRVPHTLVRRVKRTSGYSCIFTETFIPTRELQYSPLFRTGDNPVITLNTEQTAFMTTLFQKILAVYNGDYPHKSELIKSCITLIIHEALRIQPSQQTIPFKNGTTRIAHLFTDLLERQFPIERTNEPLSLRTAQDYANHLSIHVNYLNRAVKEVTGKPTSSHIAARIIAEAKALLQYSDWSVAEIAYALGFEYPAYFNNYFKRLTGNTPNSFRKV